MFSFISGQNTNPTATTTTPNTSNFGTNPTLNFSTSNNFNTNAMNNNAGTGFLSNTNTMAASNELTSFTQQTLDMQFTSLPKNLQTILLDIYKQYKKPVQQTLSTLNDTKDERFGNNQVIDQIISNMNRLKQQLEGFYQDVMMMQDKTKKLQSDCQTFGTNPMKQIQDHSLSLSETLSQTLPINPFQDALNQLESKIQFCSLKINEFSIQLNILSSNNHTSMNKYGQKLRIGPQQILALLQQQHQLLLSIASSIANVHQEIEILKAEYMKKFQLTKDPFLEADNQEKYEKQKLAFTLKAEMQESLRANQLVPGAPTQAPLAFGNTSLSANPSNQSGATFPNFTSTTQPVTSGFNVTNPTTTSTNAFGVNTSNPSQANPFGAFGANQEKRAVNALDLAGNSNFTTSTSSFPTFNPTSTTVQNPVNTPRNKKYNRK